MRYQLWLIVAAALLFVGAVLPGAALLAVVGVTAIVDAVLRAGDAACRAVTLPSDLECKRKRP